MKHRLSDHRLETVMGNLLRLGVVLAAGVVATGAVLFLLRHGVQAPNYAAFHGEPASLRHVGTIATDALHGEPRSIMQLGLLLLVATPVARVVFAVIGFLLQRDLDYALISTIVLTVLAFSLAGGHV